MYDYYINVAEMSMRCQWNVQYQCDITQRLKQTKRPWIWARSNRRNAPCILSFRIEVNAALKPEILSKMISVWPFSVRSSIWVLKKISLYCSENTSSLLQKTIMLMTFKEIVAVCGTRKHRIQDWFRAMEMYAAAWGLTVRGRGGGALKRLLLLQPSFWNIFWT